MISYIFVILMFLVFFVPALGLVMLVGWLASQVRGKERVTCIVIASTLLLTPTLGPATIAVVPVTFGWILLPTLLTWSWTELVGWVVLYPKWHAFAFPATALVSYLVARRLQPISPLT